VDLEHGFLPSQDPIQQLPKAFLAWEQLAASLPKLLVSDQLHQDIESLPTFAIEKLTTAPHHQRAMLILSFIGHAYVWGTPTAATAIPENVARPWHHVATHLQRPPVLSYASYALYNWRRLDPSRPVELGNIALLQNFYGGIDEEWFILIHVDIEAKAMPAIGALLQVQQAVVEKNIAAAVKHLTTIKPALNDMCESLDRMPEHCDPYVYYNRVRPFIHGWKDNPALPDGLIYLGVTEYQNTPQQCRGETGAQSTIIPALDCVFGITHQDDPLQHYLMEMRDYMPRAHREFLQQLEQGPALHDFVLQHGKNNKVLHDLYNDCINLIKRFRTTHLHYAATYINKQTQTSTANPTETGTGGTPFMKYLNKHMHESDDGLIS